LSVDSFNKLIQPSNALIRCWAFWL